MNSNTREDEIPDGDATHWCHDCKTKVKAEESQEDVKCK